MSRTFILSIVVLLLLNTLGFSRQNRVSISPPPADLKIDPFYTKYLDCDGITITGSDQVDDRAFYRLRDLLDHILAHRPDVKAAMAQKGFRCMIIAEEEQVTDLPEYAHMEPKDYWNQRARGFGGRTTSCGEENLLNLPGDRYTGESIFIHELAHSIHSQGLRTCEPGFQNRLDTLYRQAMDKGLYKDDYAATNASEYWAESVQAFFDCDRENDHVHNHVNTREELIAYDPDMAALLTEMFRTTPADDWRYRPYSHKLKVEATPVTYNPDGKLPRYVWYLGLPIYATAKVPDAILLKAAETIQEIFQHRYDLLKDLRNSGQIIVIYDSDTPVSSSDHTRLYIPLSTQFPAGYDQARLVSSIIRTTYQNAITSIKNSDQPTPAASRPRSNRWRLDNRFDQKVQSLYQAAMAKDLWQSTPAAQNHIEYLAQAAVPFFHAGTITTGDQKIATRDQLTRYDPALAQLLTELFLPVQQ